MKRLFYALALISMVFWCAQTTKGDDIQTTVTGYNMPANSSIWDLFWLPDNRAIVVGQFTNINGVAATNICRLNADGSVDASWGPTNNIASTSSVIDQVACDGTNLYVAGTFSSINGVPCYRFAKLVASNGVPDATFTNGIGISNRIYSMTFYNGALYVGGNFTNICGAGRTNLAKLNASTGALDSSFTNTADSTVSTLAVYEDALYAGGSFSNIGGAARDRLAKLDTTTGAADPFFRYGSVTNGGKSIFATAYFSNSLYAGGDFTVIGGVSRGGIAKLDPTTGVPDVNYTNGADIVSNNMVLALAAASNSICAGGLFSQIGGVARRNCAKLNPTNGAIDTAFTNQVGGSGQATVRKLAFRAINGTNYLYVGGSFSVMSGTNSPGLVLIRWQTPPPPAPSAIMGYDLLTNDIVYGFSWLPDNRLIVVGEFTNINGTAVHNICRLNTDGKVDGSWGPSSVDSWINKVACDGTNLYVAGDFSSIAGVSCRNFAKLDLSTGVPDAAFTNGLSGGYIDAMIFHNGALYVGGNFTNICGAGRTRLAKLNASTGALDSSFTNAADNFVWALAADGSALYAGGGFIQIGGLVREGLAKLDTTTGAADPAFTSSIDTFSSYIAAAAYFSNSLYVGGSFATIGGVSRGCVAKLDPTTGVPDVNYTKGANGPLYTLAAANDSIYAGGIFTNIGGISRKFFAKLNPSDGAIDTAITNQVESGTDVRALAARTINGINYLYVGGDFTVVSGTNSPALVLIRWQVNSTSSPPVIPTGVTASDGNRDEVRVTWTAASWVTGYEVWRNSSASTGTASLLGNTINVTYDDTIAAVGTTFYYWVKATNSYGVSLFSSYDSGYRRSPAPGEVAFNAASYTVNENAGSVTLTVTRSGGSDYAAGVNYSTLDGTAIAGVDYTVVSGTLSWSDYDSSGKTITVPIITRSGNQDRVFTVNLSGASGVTLASPSNSSVTITTLTRPSLVTDVGSLANSVFENCSVTNTAAFNVWNGADAPRGGLNYSITSSDWLSASPSSGTIINDTNTITVVWTAGSRAPGTYTDSIIVDGHDLAGNRARNAPKTINVQMTVLSRSPINYEKPVIYGIPYIGQTLAVHNGLWQNMDRLTFTYQWQRVNGTAIADLPGETTGNHVVVVADRGKYMRVAVTATDANLPPLSTTAYSELISTAIIRAAPGDFNGDGITDLWFFDPLTGMWRAAFTANSFAEGQFGAAGMTDVPGDYNGDGILDLGLYDSAHGMWYVLYLPSGPSISGSMFGGLTEETQATPVPADYDGDGRTDVALYWHGYWAILYSNLGRIVIVPPIAGADAVPVPADYDGDRVIDLGVYDSGLWIIRSALGNQWSVSFGSAAWLPAPDDYDGDGIADLGVFNQVSNAWSMIYSTSGATTNNMFTNAVRSFGSSSGANFPRQGYYDHDRYCDPATIQNAADGDFVIWCVTRTTDTNSTYRGQSYQRSINDWRVSW